MAENVKNCRSEHITDYVKINLPKLEPANLVSYQNAPLHPHCMPIRIGLCMNKSIFQRQSYKIELTCDFWDPPTRRG